MTTRSLSGLDPTEVAANMLGRYSSPRVALDAALQYKAENQRWVPGGGGALADTDKSRYWDAVAKEIVRLSGAKSRSRH